MKNKVTDMLMGLHQKMDVLLKRDPNGPMQPICGFCGKQQSEVFFLIAGFKSMICDECVANCLQMIEEKRKEVKVEQATEVGT